MDFNFVIDVELTMGNVIVNKMKVFMIVMVVMMMMMKIKTYDESSLMIFDVWRFFNYNIKNYNIYITLSLQ